MGRFSVELVAANNDDLVQVRHGQMEAKKIRRMTITGVVDPGATRLVLPQSIVDQLGLRRTGKVKVRYADGREATRDTVQDVHVELLGRDGIFTATVEPRRRSALIGAFVLEDLDLLVDCAHQRLVPRDPRYIVNEIE